VGPFLLFMNMGTMRRYTTKDEDDLIRQIESDPEIDKGWSAPIKGHVVEIRYTGNEDELSEEDKKDLEQAAEIKAGGISMTQKNDIRDLDPSTTELILFLQKGPKTDMEILARIPGFSVDTLGKVRTLELIEHCNNTVWLTGAGVHLAKSLSRLGKSL